MLKRIEVTHPSEGFDIYVDYDADTLKVESIQDSNGEEIELGAADTKAVLEAVLFAEAD